MGTWPRASRGEPAQDGETVWLRGSCLANGPLWGQQGSLWYQWSRSRLAFPSAWTSALYILLCGIKGHNTPPTSTLSHTSKSQVKCHLVSHGCLLIPKLCFFLWFIFHNCKGFSQIISSSILKFTHYSPVLQCLALLLDQRPSWKKKKKKADEWILP